MTQEQITQTEKAKALHDQLAKVNVTDVPVMSLDRSISRKEQARLARELMKQLSIKGISITAPNYSMAQSVDVSMPRRCDYELEFGIVRDGCPVRQANTEARERMEAILLAAFPRHDDRSDSQTDHFDYRWSIS